jgi:hypothetical protein
MAHQIFTTDTNYVYRKMCDCAPFDWVPSVYGLRIALGKSKKGGVLKLGLNSIYGKMAQSIGAAPYANPIWAGLITAYTRAKLMSICHYPGVKDMTIYHNKVCLCSTVLMLATDAVFSTTRLHVTKTGKGKHDHGVRRIVPSKALGDWDLEVHTSLHVIQPGLYFTSIGMPPKTRGVPRQKIVDMEDTFRKVYADLSHGRIEREDAYVMVPLKQFIGLRIANHRGALELAGEWLWCGEDGVGKKISYDWRNKRNPLTLKASLGAIDEPLITWPYNYDAGESTPYDKDIGRMMTEKRELDSGVYGAPDWADNLKNDDL